MSRPDPRRRRSRGGRTAPPGLSRRLLEWAGHRLGAPELAAAAGELFAEQARRDGRPAACRWYRRQARAALRRALLSGRDAPRKSLVGGWLAGFVLDTKLGVRMLVRYPGLTLVCGLAMAFAIAVGAGTLELVTVMVRPRLPLPDGERVVGISYWNRADSEQESPKADELLAWREELTTVEDVGGFRSLQRNLAVGEGAGEPVEAAQISAAGFRVARVPPLLGRTLVEADEEPGAPPVAVLGHRIWQTRFGGDPAVVDRTVRLGDARATVVGVMPEEFAFPIDHSLWIPLPAAELRREAGRGRSLRVFGRLAPGATLQDAQAEVTTLAAQLAQDFPERYEHLRPEVAPYAESLLGNFSAADRVMPALIYSINAFPALFLVLVCGNVGLLMSARAATRERELLVRNALGAGRGRHRVAGFRGRHRGGLRPRLHRADPTSPARRAHRSVERGPVARIAFAATPGKPPWLQPSSSDDGPTRSGRAEPPRWETPTTRAGSAARRGSSPAACMHAGRGTGPSFQCIDRRACAGECAGPRRPAVDAPGRRLRGGACSPLRRSGRSGPGMKIASCGATLYY